MEKAEEKTAKKERRDGYCKKERRKKKNRERKQSEGNDGLNLNIWCCMLVNVNYSVDRFFS